MGGAYRAAVAQTWSLVLDIIVVIYSTSGSRASLALYRLEQWGGGKDTQTAEKSFKLGKGRYSCLDGQTGCRRL